MWVMRAAPAPTETNGPPARRAQGVKSRLPEAWKKPWSPAGPESTSSAVGEAPVATSKPIQGWNW